MLVIFGVVCASSVQILRATNIKKQQARMLESIVFDAVDSCICSGSRQGLWRWQNQMGDLQEVDAKTLALKQRVGTFRPGHKIPRQAEGWSALFFPSLHQTGPDDRSRQQPGRQRRPV